MDNDRILMKNNYLIKAKYDLSLIQSRVFIVMLYKLQKDNNGEMSCTIQRNELKQIINKKSSHSIKGMTEVLNDLMKQTIYFKEIKPNSKHCIWGKYNLINGFEYDDEFDSFKIVCSTRVYELLTNYLEIGYTPINLTIFLSLKSCYAQRMYDLLRLWSGTKRKITYSVQELKELLMVQDKYKSYTDFQRNVITPAVKNLNNTGMFEITYTTKKTGRTVTDIIFDVKDLDKRKYFDKKDNIQLNPPLNTSEENNKTMDILNKYLTNGTRILFDKDFEEYKNNLNDEYFVNALYDSISITLDKDKVNIIDNSSYKYFKRTLENKLKYYIDLEVQSFM